MTSIRHVIGTGVPLLLDDIDTDRIIPARYLRCVTFEGLGAHAFEDDRLQDQRHPFDDPRFQNGSILVAGRNFGCGSSREHAPQALIRWGIQAIVAESFAEIFFGNCTSLGIPCVSASRDDLERLSVWIDAEPQGLISVDLEANRLTFGDDSCTISIDAGAREALLSGRYDFLSQLLEAEHDIRTTAGALPYVSQFA